MLLMIEKGIRGGICHAIHDNVKANNKYMKDHKNKESSYLKYQNVIIYMVGQCLCCEKLPANNFEQIEETSQFNENYLKNYNEESDEAYYLEVDVQYPQNFYMNFTWT